MRREIHKLREQMHTMKETQLKLDGSLNFDVVHSGEGDAAFSAPDLDKNE